MTGIPLLLVDGHNLLWRACYGTPAQIWSRDPDGKRDITTQFMFFALLRKGINDELGTWPEVIICFDGQHGAASRQQSDPGYKANRAAGDEALRPIRALPDIKSGLDAHRIAWIELTDAEADDVIATLAAASPGRDMLIMSTDQDYYQLLRDPAPGQGSIQVLNTAMRPGRRIIGPAQVHARYGVTPAQYPDFRALCGDTSDNLPGVRGIGPKSAAALLSGGLTLENLPATGQLTGRAAAIRDTWDQVHAWRAMIRMRTGLPVPAMPGGQPTTPLPAPAQVIDRLGLWRRPADSPVPAHAQTPP
jgi:DNA polymerase I